MFSFLKKKEIIHPDLSFIGVDMHSHLLPGIDDGVQTIAESLTCIKTLQHLGYKKLICTPHIISDMYPNDRETILPRLEEIREALKENNIDIAIAKSNIISVLLLENKIYHLLTLHRNYNVDNKQVLEYILDQLGKLEDQIIFPIHPRTRKMLTTNFIVPQNIRIVEPLGYLDFITLENFANKIITDSGGIQKESYILRKPCVTLRTETEWTETVEEKWNLLINPRDKKMAEKIVEFKQPNTQKEIFGKKVTGKMVKIIDEIC